MTPGGVHLSARYDQLVQQLPPLWRDAHTIVYEQQTGQCYAAARFPGIEYATLPAHRDLLLQFDELNKELQKCLEGR